MVKFKLLSTTISDEISYTYIYIYINKPFQVSLIARSLLLQDLKHPNEINQLAMIHVNFRSAIFNRFCFGYFNGDRSCPRRSFSVGLFPAFFSPLGLFPAFFSPLGLFPARSVPRQYFTRQVFSPPVFPAIFFYSTKISIDGNQLSKQFFKGRNREE